jgi:peptidoglycan hydrolase FlgJ
MAFDYSIHNLQTTINDTPADQQLDKLRQHLGTAATSKGEPNLQELRTATQEFEALFVNYMLKVMRSTIEPADEEASGLGKDVYMSMFDQEISLNIARSQSLGVGELLFKQLEGRLPERTKVGKTEGTEEIKGPQTSVTFFANGSYPFATR